MNQTRPWLPRTLFPELVAAQEVANSLGVSPDLGNRIIRCGLLGNIYRMGIGDSRLAGDRSELDKLLQMPVIDQIYDTAPPAVIAKAAPAEITDQPGFEYGVRGWDRSMPEDIAEDATNKWWPLGTAIRDKAIGSLLVVAVGTIVVRVRRIDDVIAPAGPGHVQFVTSEASGEDAEFYRGSRVAAQRGPTAAPINL